MGNGRTFVFSRREFVKGLGTTAATTAMAGCSRLPFDSQTEPTQRWHFRTSESIVQPSQLYLADGVEYLTVTRLTDPNATPHLRNEYLESNAEPISKDLQLDFDRHAAVLIETVLPEYQELSNRKVTNEDGTLSYSYRIVHSGDYSNATLVTHVLDVWDQDFLSDIDSIDVHLRYNSEDST